MNKTATQRCMLKKSALILNLKVLNNNSKQNHYTTLDNMQ